MGSSIEFPDITFKGTLRPSQEAAVSVIQPQVEQGEKKLHIVAPPGSGKTILGLYVWAELLKNQPLFSLRIQQYKRNGLLAPRFLIWMGMRIN
ncbi:MAG: DEAD/DEAH box helicase family protein [archaeon]|nr:DEAD/DEAH box helicase family protein [archaeon]